MEENAARFTTSLGGVVANLAAHDPVDCIAGGLQIRTYPAEWSEGRIGDTRCYQKQGGRWEDVVVLSQVFVDPPGCRASYPGAQDHHGRRGGIRGGLTWRFIQMYVLSDRIETL